MPQQPTPPIPQIDNDTITEMTRMILEDGKSFREVAEWLLERVWAKAFR